MWGGAHDPGPFSQGSSLEDGDIFESLVESLMVRGVKAAVPTPPTPHPHPPPSPHPQLQRERESGLFLFKGRGILEVSKHPLSFKLKSFAAFSPAWSSHCYVVYMKTPEDLC